jgi:hypothetical protein
MCRLACQGKRHGTSHLGVVAGVGGAVYGKEPTCRVLHLGSAVRCEVHNASIKSMAGTNTACSVLLGCRACLITMPMAKTIVGHAQLAQTLSYTWCACAYRVCVVCVHAAQGCGHRVSICALLAAHLPLQIEVWRLPSGDKGIHPSWYNVPASQHACHVGAQTVRNARAGRGSVALWTTSKLSRSLYLSGEWWWRFWVG